MGGWVVSAAGSSVGDHRHPSLTSQYARPRSRLPVCRISGRKLDGRVDVLLGGGAVDGVGVLLVPADAAVHRGCDEHDTDETGDVVRDLDEQGREHHDREDGDRPVGAVLQVAVLRQLAGVQQVVRHRPDEQGADAQAQGDDDDRVRDREGTGDAVEAEARVLALQVHELAEAGGPRDDSATRDGHVAGVGGVRRFELLELVLVLALEHVADRAQQHEEHHAHEAVEQDFGVVLDLADDDHGGPGDDERHHVHLADGDELPLDGAEPQDRALLQEVVERDQGQVRGAEGDDLGVRVVQVLGVLVGVRDGEVDHGDRVQVGGDRDDGDGEDEPHAEDGDEDAPRHEATLPRQGHGGQHHGVDDGVVEGERDLQHTQDQVADEGLDSHQHADADTDDGRDTEVDSVVSKCFSHDSLPVGNLRWMFG